MPENGFGQVAGSPVMEKVGHCATRLRFITVLRQPEGMGDIREGPEWRCSPFGSTGLVMGAIVRQFRSHVVKQQIRERLYELVAESFDGML